LNYHGIVFQVKTLLPSAHKKISMPLIDLVFNKNGIILLIRDLRSWVKGHCRLTQWENWTPSSLKTFLMVLAINPENFMLVRQNEWFILKFPHLRCNFNAIYEMYTPPSIKCWWSRHPAWRFLLLKPVRTKENIMLAA
jgi:hypothetical protein